MEFHLPALTRYLAETGVASPRAASGLTDRGGQRDATQTSELTRMLSDQLLVTNPPTRLPKALEAYYAGPAARGYQPIDLDAQYIVPFNKSPPRPPVSTTADSDPNTDHIVRPMGRSSSPLALGPPLHSSLQSGQVASLVTASVNTAPLDWSFLFGSPPPASPQQHLGSRSSDLPASVATYIRPVKVGVAAAAAAVTASAAGKKISSNLASQLRKPSTSETGSGILGRRINPSVAAMPPTPEAKFCSAIMNVMERLAATQSIQTGRYRSLRLQAAEHREAIISTVVMPPPPKTGAFSSKAAANRMATVLQKSGATLDDMQAIVRQIQQFKGLSDDLRAAVAQQFQLFSYPPGSYLYEQDCTCDEAFVLISGTVMLHAEGRPPHRLQAGTVLGVELMLRRQPVPLTVTTDPHFEAQLAVLSWHSYESIVRRWAADKVCALMPELQASQVARLKGGLMRGISYAQRQPGEALYVGGQPTENVILLVQGQVLLAAPLEPHALVTQAQMVSLLRVMMGHSASAMVLNEMPRTAMTTRGGLRGGLKSAGRPSVGPSGSVRLSGDSSGEAAAAAAAATAPDNSAVGDGGSGRHRHIVADAGNTSRKGVGVSPWSVSGEVDGDGGVGDSLLGVSGGGGGGGEQTPPQRRHVSLVRALRNSSNRNSRRAIGGVDAAAATAEGAGGPAVASAAAVTVAEVTPPPPALAPHDSVPSVGAANNEYVAVEEGAGGPHADVDAAGDGSESELNRASELTAEGMESAAAADSRLNRVSLRFADAANTGSNEANEVDIAAEVKVVPTEIEATAVPEQTGPGISSSRSSRPFSSPSQSGSPVPEPSLLPAVSAFDLAADVDRSVVDPSNREEAVSPVEPLPGSAISGALAVQASFGPGLVPPLPPAADTKTGLAFAEGDSVNDGSGGDATYGGELQTPSVHQQAPLTLRSSSGDLGEMGPGEGALSQAVRSRSDSSGGGDSGDAAAATVASENNSGGSGGGGGCGITAPPDSTPAPEKESSVAGGARDTGDSGGSTSANESRPGPGGAAAAAAGSPPLSCVSSVSQTPKSGLRSKIGGVSARHLQHSQSRGASRGTAIHSSGASSPRSVSVSRADSITKASAAGRGANGGRGEESSGPSRNSLRASHVAAAAAAAAAEGRSTIRPVSQSALTESTGRPRRPSSPTSEAPSVDERRPESTTLLVHPILPPPPPPRPSIVQILNSDDEDDSGGPAAAAAAPDLRIRNSEFGLSSTGRGSGRTRTSSDAELARASTEGMPPTPPAQQPGQHSQVFASLALALPPQLSAAQQPGAVATQEHRASANAGVRLSTGNPNPDIDYSVARVGGAAMPGTGGPKASGDASRTADGRPARKKSTERVNTNHAPRVSGGGGVRKHQRDSGHVWSYTGSPGASAGPGGGGGPSVAAAAAAAGAAQPLANALASQCKLHQHRVVAVYGAPVVFCEEALLEQKEPDTMKPASPLAANSAVALQRCEYILIPAALLRSLLPTEAVPQLLEAAVAAQRRLVTASGNTEDSGPVTWPAAADKIRDILSTSTPGHRQPWQVELLASAFSHLPVFSRLSWQVRLRVFQDLEYRKLEPGDHLDLAKLDVTEIPLRPSETNNRKSSVTAEGGGDIIGRTCTVNGDGGDGAHGGEVDVKPLAGHATPPAMKTPRADEAAAPAAPPADAAAAAESRVVRPTAAGLPRVSEAPSSLPSRSPSYTGDLPSPPRWSSGAEDAAASAAVHGENGAALSGSREGYQAPSNAPLPRADSSSASTHASGKVPWALRYGSRHIVYAGLESASTLVDVSGTTGELAEGELAAQATLAAAATAANSDDIALVGSITQLAVGPGADGGTVKGGLVAVTGMAEVFNEPSVSTLPYEVPEAMHAAAVGAPHPPTQGAAAAMTRSKAAPQPGEAMVAAAGELKPYTSRYLSSTSTEPHPVEALFNPAELQPLIPSLALLQRDSGSADVHGDVGSKPSAATTSTVAAAVVTANSPAAVAVAAATNIAATAAAADAEDGGSGVEFPVLGERVDSPQLLTRTASLERSGRQNWTAGTEGTLDSEPVSVSKFSVNSLTPMASHGSSPANVLIIDSSDAAAAAAAAAAGVAAVASAADVTGPSTAKAVARSSGHELRRQAVAEKLDDRTYWCLSGEIVLEAVQIVQEPSSEGDADPNTVADEDKASDSLLPPPLPLPPPPLAAEQSASSTKSGNSQGQRSQGQQSQLGQEPQDTRHLQVASSGDAFSGGALAEAATAAFATATAPQAGPAAAAVAAAPPTPPPELQQQLLQVLPLGCSVLRARVAASPAEAGAAGGAEVLCMSRTMFELLSRGIGRSVPPAVLPVLARHVDWLAGVDIPALAADLAGHYRLEEHKQGTELLRAGEPAPVVFLVASGECVMRGPVVGLKEPGTVAGTFQHFSIDLAHNGFSIVNGLRSSIRGVTFYLVDMLDLATLREGSTCGELSLLAARPLWYTLVVASSSAKVVSLDMPALRSWLLTSEPGRTAAADVVTAIAEVDVALYGRAVKQIAVQVMNERLELSLFNSPMKKILIRILEDNAPELTAILERQREQQQQEAKGAKDRKGSSPNADGAGGTGSGGGAAATGASKRPRDIVLEGWSQVEAIAASLARPYDPQAQSWELIAQARYNAARRSHTRYLDSLLTASQLSTKEDPSGHASGDQRIAMPAPGLIAEAMAEPGPVRLARQYDIRTVPKDLRGGEVESSRLSWDCSYVPLHELTTMMSAHVHVKQAAALQLLRPVGHSERSEFQRSPTGSATVAAPPPGTSAAIGASNYLLAQRKDDGGGGGGGVGGEASAASARQRSGGIRRGSTAASSNGATLVPTAPWDAKGRLPRARIGSTAVAATDDGGTPRSPSPSRVMVFRDKGLPSPSAWSMAPLDTLAGRVAENLSHAASCSSLALLDPDMRIQLDLDLLSDEPISPNRGYREAALSAVAAAIAAGGASDAFTANPLQRPTASYDSPTTLHKSLGSIPEERSRLPFTIPLEDLTSSLRLGSGTGTAAPLSARSLPPLLPPHDAMSRAATRQSLPAPVVPGRGASPPETGRMTTTAATTTMPTAAAPPAGNAKRSRIQPRASSSSSSSQPASSPVVAAVESAEDPARSFWVRDKLHDPRGLAETIMADAAARAVGQTVAAAAAATAVSGTRSGVSPRPEEIAAAASGNAGANVLMAAGGRTGLPSGSRTTRLQPLRRNGALTGAPGPGGAAAAAAAAAAMPRVGTADGSTAPFARGGGGATAATPPPPPLSPVDSEMLYVTLQLPEAPKILPEFPSAATAREAAEAAESAAREAREARIAAAIAHHSTRPLRIRPDMKYVPQYLRQRQRGPVIPAPAVPLPEGTTESWAVPSYNSEVGFQDGFYDENSQVIYFD